MIRKASLLLAGVALGAIVAVTATQTRFLSGSEANRGLGRHLSRAQPVRRRVRTGPRRLRRGAGRERADRIGDQRHARRARPPFELPEPQELQGHAGPDQRQVRRSRDRGDHGGGGDQGRLPDRRHARLARRHPRRRSDHRARRRAHRRPQPERRGREDARAGQYPDHAYHRPRRRREAFRRQARPRGDHHPVGALAAGRRCRLYPHQLLQRADLRRPQGGHRQARGSRSGRRRSRAGSSTSGTIPAACSTRRLRSPTPSSTAARSSRPGAATPRRPSATTPIPAISPTASR